ncbi:glycoside hydrolase/deacetylase [Neocallimastix lanati (nom. inval.)]|jgi:peptidoglycan/xylan/chitin deacetylase (PgdA/CDA1 family)|uniref:Glycoside hydrolase/deacetylase n=1 Tax=Neocallimastix californiae TaxID=1754190 RepID=A0A1Y2B125_9FUNG|nr:glycoside hydrolase/deacetylase [Neocallimastix sp. JGI-2020a]ORY28539.1 glycoside hydrolase/deacetylase [Neocallimastix californiae]|eukprot:ORY28539.1 glycoside hydrolase/deacetylase [Neocallimastix californiae]
MKFSNVVLSALAVSACAGEMAEIYYTCKVPNTIAFTIDDGPTKNTPELLAALKAANITATFYVNAANVLKDPQGNPLPTVVPFIKDIYEAGHEIGSHTYNHACLTEQCVLNNPGMKVMNTKEAFSEQILNNEKVIFDAIGKYPASYRAPFGDGQNPGAVNDTLKEWLFDLGYPYAIHWDIETQDMEFSNQSVDIAFAKAQEHYTSDIANHQTLITLQHAIPVTIEKIIPWVKSTWMPAHPNMRFVTVSECLGLPSDAVYKTVQGKIEKAKPQKDSSISNFSMTRVYLTLLFTTLFTIFYLY